MQVGLIEGGGIEFLNHGSRAYAFGRIDAPRPFSHAAGKGRGR